jgi:hypothetical protein
VRDGTGLRNACAACLKVAKFICLIFAGIRYYRQREIMTGRDFLPGPDGSLLGVPLAPEFSGG